MLCRCMCSFARTKDEKLVRSMDAQCNTEESPQSSLNVTDDMRG